MTFAVRCGTLIDGTGSEPVRGATLVFEGDTITAIDRGGEAPRDAAVIDAQHLTVMPGMIDCHVHFASQSSWSIQERLLTPYSLLVAHALNNARVTLEAGFTSVRDAAGTPRGVKQAIDQGLFPGPRMRIAVSALSQTGGHGDSTMPNGANIRPSIEMPMTVVDGIEGVRRATREVLRAGADQIKVHTSGGVMSPNDEPGATGFSPDEIATLVYEARAAGKTVMAHAQATQGIKNAVLGGIDSIEHGIYLDEETIEAMKQRGTYFVPTLVAPLWVLRRAEKDPSSVPPYAVRKAREVLDDHRNSFRLAVERGVRIAMGTDTGVGPHGTNAEELQRMVEGGMTPMQAMVATTKTAAECTRIAHLTGTLEVGKRADLLAVDGDPVADISVLQDKERLHLIVRDGNVFKSTINVPATAG
ncbi:MAG TPA: amidohydrolase family protein [Chloroflexota bacterium]|nr:amidohydrolase family protein [Chloroflexota bacterium]